MVNVGINIRYIGSYKLRLWVFTSFSVDLICITTFFYTSTGGARWEYHSAAWLNHESNHHFSGHDPIMSRDLCCIPSPWLPWFFYEFLSVLSEKQNTHTHQKTPASQQSCFFSKVDGGPPTWCRRENCGTIEMLKLGYKYANNLPVEKPIQFLWANDNDKPLV